MSKQNIDESTVAGFGDEWERFDQSDLESAEAKQLFDSYFNIFPWNSLPEDAVGFDLGCGSGRWAKFVSPIVGRLHCIDPSSALEIAKNNLRNFNNCEFYSASVDTMPLVDESMDFGYSLGVLHHIPDTQAAMSACVRKLKKGAPFLVYLYYSFDNRPVWFRMIWRLSDFIRYVVSRLPHKMRYVVSQLIAGVVYFPLARLLFLAEKLGLNINNMPLASYRKLSFYTMRTDALDRFGTQLEQRFTRDEIKNLMKNSGLENIKFSSESPYWCAVGYRSHSDQLI